MSAGGQNKFIKQWERDEHFECEMMRPGGISTKTIYVQEKNN